MFVKGEALSDLSRVMKGSAHWKAGAKKQAIEDKRAARTKARSSKSEAKAVLRAQRVARRDEKERERKASAEAKRAAREQQKADVLASLPLAEQERRSRKRAANERLLARRFAAMRDAGALQP